MAKHLPLKSFRLQNFKAIRDSGVVEFTPLTVLIGDNGSGKSSLVEGLQTYHKIVTEGLDEAMAPWRGFEYVRTSALPAKLAEEVGSPLKDEVPMSFCLRHSLPSLTNQNKRSVHPHTVKVATLQGENQTRIVEEEWRYGRRRYLRRDIDDRTVIKRQKKKGKTLTFPFVLPRSCWPLFAVPEEEDDAHSNAIATAHYVISSWQFLTLSPYSMGQPIQTKSTGGTGRLNSDGSNIAEYLSDIIARDKESFDSILGAMQFVMPYLQDLRPVLTEVLGRQMHLEMTEADFRVMGWLLSTGTLRILALLAVLRNPDPPPLIVIEEIENGLDPRTLQLILEEIRNVVESGQSQVIATTHSPYLLDLMDLSDIVVVERKEPCGPSFFRPSDLPDFDRWAEDFGPGRLYTMQGLRSGAS